MAKYNRNTIATVIVCVFGFILLFVATDGFRAYTAETARINQLNKELPVFPKVTFEDSKKRQYSIDEFENQYVFITFIYTSCTTVCVELERNMSEVYRLVPDEYLGKDISFLSISFDPQRDTPEVLEKYMTYFESDGETWRMARIKDQGELDALLHEFGVIVIPDESGHFAHNTAFYLIDKEAKLVEIMNYKNIDEAAEKIIQTIEKGRDDV